MDEGREILLDSIYAYFFGEEHLDLGDFMVRLLTVPMLTPRRRKVFGLKDLASKRCNLCLDENISILKGKNRYTT